MLITKAAPTFAIRPGMFAGHKRRVVPLKMSRSFQREIRGPSTLLQLFESVARFTVWSRIFPLSQLMDLCGCKRVPPMATDGTPATTWAMPCIWSSADQTWSRWHPSIMPLVGVLLQTRRVTGQHLQGIDPIEIASGQNTVLLQLFTRHMGEDQFLLLHLRNRPVQKPVGAAVKAGLGTQMLVGQVFLVLLLRNAFIDGVRVQKHKGTGSFIYIRM